MNQIWTDFEPKVMKILLSNLYDRCFFFAELLNKLHEGLNKPGENNWCDERAVVAICDLQFQFLFTLVQSYTGT